MWSISDLKQRARTVLRDSYWKSLLAFFVVLAMIYGASMVFSFLVYTIMMVLIAFLMIYGNAQGNPAAHLPAIIAVFLSAIVGFWVVSIGLTCFLMLPMEVGLCYYFMCARNRRFLLADIFHAFSGHRYLHIVKVCFFRYLFQLLWSLLLLIPGIVKYYEYFFVSYILSENPNLSRKRVFALSRLMTDGEKMHIFRFQLSFIGWYLLSALTCGVGFIFLLPYIKAAEAELYAAMRDKLFYEGTSDPQELPGYPC